MDNGSSHSGSHSHLKEELIKKFNSNLLYTKEPSKDEYSTEQEQYFIRVKRLMFDYVKEIENEALSMTRDYYYLGANLIKMKKGTCPTPHKKSYKHRSAADQETSRMIKTARGRKIAPRSYQCQCGYFHITSSSYQYHKKIQKTSDSKLSEVIIDTVINKSQILKKLTMFDSVTVMKLDPYTGQCCVKFTKNTPSGEKLSFRVSSKGMKRDYNMQTIGLDQKFDFIEPQPNSSSPEDKEQAKYTKIYAILHS